MNSSEHPPPPTRIIQAFGHFAAVCLPGPPNPHHPPADLLTG